MKIIDIYRLAIENGIKKDPRTRAEIRQALADERKEFRKSKGIDRRAFDRERFTNPYADTRILYGDPATNVRTVMIGVDMEAPEILAADRMGEKGAPVDLVIAHHPEGPAWARFYDVMRLQVAVLRKFGIPSEVGKELLKERMDEVSRAVAPANHTRSVDIARLLGIPYMCVHTPADNHVTDYLQRLFERKTPKTVGQVVSMLKAIPEYADAVRKNAGPRILIGEAKKPSGRILVDMIGGTEGSKRVFARLSQAGVGTIIAMHLSEDHFKQAKVERLNVIIAGHIASDTLGLNLLFDAIDRKGELKIMNCSGFVRVRR